MKVPLTVDGIKATKILSDEGIAVNVTLCFSSGQALLAAKAGATFISPFVGRLDDIGLEGMNLIQDIRLIYDNYGFDTEILTKIYQRQAKCNGDNKNRLAEGKKEKDDRIMLVMDDCMSSKGTWVKDQNILELFFNGRHHHVSFILTMQYAVGIPPEMRSNFDYIFLLAEDFISNQKRLYEHYAGMFPSFDIFKQVFAEVTQNYGVMVINNRIHSSNITDKVFWYKAKKVPEFKMGSRIFNKYHKKYYDPEWNKRPMLFDPSDILSRKRNNFKVNVKKIKDDSGEYD